MTMRSSCHGTTRQPLRVVTLAAIAMPLALALASPPPQEELPAQLQEQAPVFGPMPGTTPEEWDEIQNLTDLLLDASEDAMELTWWLDQPGDKKDRRSRLENWPLEIAEEEWGTVFYPTTHEDALNARSRLLGYGPKSVPALLSHLRVLDPRDPLDIDRARFATSILAELAYGHFPWRQGGRGEELPRDATAIDCWTALWSLVVEDPSYWNVVASRGTAQQLPRSWEHPESDLMLGLFEGEQQFIKIEPVLELGQRLRVTNDAGTIEVHAGEGFGRYYTWDGETRFVVLDPAYNKQGDHESVGLSYPGPGDHWKDNHGISRGVLQEGCKNFPDVDSAMAWIDAQNYMDFVHTNSGLVLGWSKNLSRRQINADIWQVYVNGAKPEALPGSTDDKLTLVDD